MLLIVTFVFTLLLYSYVKRVYFTASDSVPGIPPQFLVGNLLQTGLLWQGKPMCLVLQEMQAKLGDVFQFWIGSIRLIVVSGHEDIQHIFARRHVYEQGGTFIDKYRLINPDALICLNGPKYKRHAGAINFLFRRHKIIRHLDVINDCTDKLTAKWRATNHESTHIHLNMVKHSQQLLMDITGFIAFDIDLQSLDGGNHGYGNELNQALQTYLSTTAVFAQLPLFMGHIYMLLNFRYRRARKIIDQYLDQMIERGQSETKAELTRVSLIASMIASLQEDECLEATKSEAEKRGLSRTEVKHEMLSLLGGAFGTTSTTLAWFIHLMSKHPRIQDKIKRELMQYNQQRLSVEQLDQLVYLECVLRELFRFVPPIIGALRRLTADDRLPTSGIPLKKDDDVFISIYNLGRDPRYWSGSVGPDQFYPERFLTDDDPKSHNKLASIVFGGGHRQCIGQDLARFALKAVCARLMQCVTFGDGGDELNSGGYQQKETLWPRNVGVTVTFNH